MKEPIYRGSVKDVYRIDTARLEFAFSDRVSIFDVVMLDDVPGKGEALCDMACHWFKIVDGLGIDHHFIERSGPRSIVVKPVTIIRDNEKIIDGHTNHLVPLEFIARHYVAGMLFDRIKSGKIPPEQLGFGPGTPVSYGAKLPRPFFEMSTKLEPVDRFVTLGISVYVPVEALPKSRKRYAKPLRYFPIEQRRDGREVHHVLLRNLTIA